MEDENGHPGSEQNQALSALLPHETHNNDEVDGGDDMAMHAFDDMVSTVDVESPMSLSISEELARVTVDRAVSHSIRSISSHCGYLEKENSKKIAIFSKSSCSTPPVNDDVGLPAYDACRRDVLVGDADRPHDDDASVEESETEGSACGTNSTTNPRMGPRNGLIGAPSSTLLEQLQLRWGELEEDTRIPISARDTENEVTPPPSITRLGQPLQLSENHGGSEEEVMASPSSGEDYGHDPAPTAITRLEQPLQLSENHGGSEEEVMASPYCGEDYGHDPAPTAKTRLEQPLQLSENHGGSEEEVMASPYCGEDYGHDPAPTAITRLDQPLQLSENHVGSEEEVMASPYCGEDYGHDPAPTAITRLEQPLQLREHGGSEEEVMTSPSSGKSSRGDPPKFRVFSEHPQLMLERSEGEQVMTPRDSGREDKGGQDPCLNQTSLLAAAAAPTISRLGANSEDDAMTPPIISPSRLSGNNRAEATSLLGKKPSREQPHAELNMINQFLTGFLEDEVADTLSSLRHSRASSRPGSRSTSHGSGSTNNMRLFHPFETHTATTTAGDGSIAASLNTMMMGGKKQQFGGQLDPSLLSLIRAQVRKVLDDELPSRTRPASNPVSPTSHGRFNSTSTANEEQHALLVDLLRKKEEDAISLREELTKKDEVIGVCEKKIRNQAEAISDLESRHTQLTEELAGSRMAERNAIATAELIEQRHDETCKKLSEARKHTIEEGDKTQGLVDRMKAGQKIELDAYRKALAAEESRVIALKETVKLLEKDLRQNRSSKDALRESPRWDTSVDKSMKRKPKKSTIPKLQDIYVPLLERTAPRLPRVPSNNALPSGPTRDNHIYGGSHVPMNYHHPPVAHTMLPEVQQNPRMYELTQSMNSYNGAKKGAPRMFQLTNCSTALDHYYNP